jgi:hypothetical protein
MIFGALLAVAGTAPQPTIADTATPAPNATLTPPPKDPCAKSRSKWAHVQCMAFNESAPGDEYFGVMKESFIGIDNTFRDGVISAGDNTIDQRLIHKLDFAADALANWAKKYPNDPQLPRSYYLGVKVYIKVYTQPGQERAWQYMQLLVHKYPNTYFGKTIKASLANGYAEHWYAAAAPCATALPADAIEPVPSPSPSPVAGQARVELIAPPCIPPPSTPTPEPSPTPTPHKH